MLGALIGAGTSLIGGLLGKSSADKAAEIQAENNRLMLADKEKDRELQREFAQSGIRWKAADAAAAGIHPLYALGAQTTSYAPSSVGLASPAPDYSMSNAMAAAGQDLSRAIDSGRTAPERAAAVKQTMLALDGMQLDNDIKRATLMSSLQRIQQNANPPIPELKPEGRPGLWLGGEKVETDPNTSNTEGFTTRYGEGADWYYGPQVWYQDFKYRNRNMPDPTTMVRQKFGNPPDWWMRWTGERR